MTLISKTLLRAALATALLGAPLLPASMTEGTGLVAQVQAFTPFPGGTAPQSLTSAQLGQDVVVTGTIHEAVPSRASNVPTQLTLTPEGHEPRFVIVYWEDSFAEVEQGRGTPPVGTRVSVRGELSEHRGALQVRVNRGAQIRIEGYDGAAAPAAATPQPRTATEPPALPEDGYYRLEHLPALVDTMIDQIISIKAPIAGYRAPWSDRAPSLIQLSGPGGRSLEIVYWAPRDGSEAPRYDETGRTIHATGQLQEYDGRLQVRINDLEDLSYDPLPESHLARERQSTGAATSPASEGWPGGRPAAQMETLSLPDGAPVAINELSPAHAGNTITVEGRVGRVFQHEGSTYTMLTLGVSTAFVRLPADFDRLLVEAATVSAKGKVVLDEVRTIPIIVPASPGDVTIKEQ